MIGIVIATHANLGQAMIDAVTLIAGKQTKVTAIGLNHGDSMDDFAQQVFHSLMDLDEGDGVIGFCDFLGGTPANVMMKCMQKKSFPCFTGVNMPMLVEALMSRESMAIDDLKAKCLAAGMEGMVNLQKILKNMTSENVNQEDEI